MTEPSDASCSPLQEPQWFDKKYLIKILNAHTKNQLREIKSYTIKPATVKGENFASAIHLITVEYISEDQPENVQNASLIMKSRLEDEFMAQIEQDFNVFDREAQVYTTIMPEIHKLLQTIGEDTKLAPRAIYVDDRVIVQENLRLQGYSIEDVKCGLNYEQCRIVLGKLAKFHAATMVLYKKNPDMFRHHLPSNISEHASPLHDIYINAIKACAEYCQTNPKLERYVAKLDDFGAKIIPKLINVFSRNLNDRYHVLNHGDMWVNNLMFRNDANGQTITDVLLVDYQEGFFGSPGIDWNYFMFSSWQKQVFVDNREELIEYYTKILSEILNKLNYVQRIPTADDVNKEIINKGYHGLTTATCLLPILINEHSHLADPINFLVNSPEALENRRIVYNNPKYGEKLELYLEYFEKTGIL